MAHMVQKRRWKALNRVKWNLCGDSKLILNGHVFVKQIMREKTKQNTTTTQKQTKKPTSFVLGSDMWSVQVYIESGCFSLLPNGSVLVSVDMQKNANIHWE